MAEDTQPAAADPQARAEQIAMIVAAYVENNPLPAAELGGLITQVAGVLDRLASPLSDETPNARPSPAAVRKSITPEALVSFIDGKPYRTLRRHLRTHGLTPEQYRAKYGLPLDYPTTAPAYSDWRSAMARASGFGRKVGARAKQVAAAVQEATGDAVTLPKRRGRPPKATAPEAPGGPAEVVGVIETLAAEASPPPKRRGRPPKPKS